MLEILTDEMDVELPGSRSYLLAVVDKLGNASESLVCRVLSFFGEAKKQTLLQNFFKLKVELRLLITDVVH